VVVESHDDFPGVEISIAGGVGEMVRGPVGFYYPLAYRLFDLGEWVCFSLLVVSTVGWGCFSFRLVLRGFLVHDFQARFLISL